MFHAPPVSSPFLARAAHHFLRIPCNPHAILGYNYEHMYVNAENKVYMILYSKYNEEGDYYWYSINDSRFDELKKYSGCNVLFIMGSNKEIISYPVEHLKLKLDRCGHSSEDLAKKKQAHYHFYLRITDKGKVLFKLSNPVEFEDVTRFVIKE